MKIGIIGTGNMGKALHKALSRAGHEVVLGSRKAADVNGIKAVSIKDAAASAPVVILATPFEAAKESLSAAGRLEGKTLIDITNPLAPDFSALTIGHTTSAGEQVALLAGGAKVVKAFNHIFSAVLEQGADSRALLRGRCGCEGNRRPAHPKPRLRRGRRGRHQQLT
jgi:predicted dinucleotide-binding enzyme